MAPPCVYVLLRYADAGPVLSTDPSVIPRGPPRVSWAGHRALQVHCHRAFIFAPQCCFPRGICLYDQYFVKVDSGSSSCPPVLPSGSGCTREALRLFKQLHTFKVCAPPRWTDLRGPNAPSGQTSNIGRVLQMYHRSRCTSGAESVIKQVIKHHMVVTKSAFFFVLGGNVYGILRASAGISKGNVLAFLDWTGRFACIGSAPLLLTTPASFTGMPRLHPVQYGNTPSAWKLCLPDVPGTR